MTLSELGYRVLEAKNGQEALKLLQESQNSTNLVISDMVMPEMAGPGLQQQLPQQHPEIKLLFVTGNTLQGDRGVLAPKGVVWIQKPFRADQLGRALRRVLAETQ